MTPTLPSKKIKMLLRIGVEALQLRRKERFCLAAIGLSKNKEIFIGFPTKKTHPGLVKFESWTEDYHRWIHAEQALCLQARANNAELTHILVIRLHKKFGYLKLAKPCEMCQNTIKEFQPHAKVFYSTDALVLGTLQKA
jgi:cytidine deaminase